MNTEDVGAFIGEVLLAGLLKPLQSHIEAHGPIHLRVGHAGEPLLGDALLTALEDAIPVKQFGFVWRCEHIPMEEGSLTYPVVLKRCTSEGEVWCSYGAYIQLAPDEDFNTCIAVRSAWGPVPNPRRIP